MAVTRSRRLAAGLVLVLGVGLAGCTSAGGTTSAGDSGGAAAPAGSGGGGAVGAERSAADAAAALDSAAGGARTDAAKQAPLVTVQQTARRIVQTVDLELSVRDVRDAATEAEQLARGAGGFVAEEATNVGATNRRRTAALTLRVPTRGLEGTLDRLADLGRVLERRRTAEDVTEQVVDVAARVATQRASVERVRRLLAEATSLGQVVTIEGQLAKREAELESLLQRRAELADLTSLATVRLQLSTAAAPAAVSAAAEADSGFAAGLRSGWAAFVTGATGLATVTGAVLPFAVVAAVVLVPVWLGLRRRRTPVAPAPVPEA